MLRGMRMLTVALAALAAWSAVAANAATDEAQPEETRICPGCGAEIPVTAVFCPNCHRYLPDAKLPTKKCPGCGEDVLATRKLCPKCGALLTKPVAKARAAEPEGRAAPSRPEWKTRFSGRVRAGAMVTEGYTVPGGTVVLGARVSEEIAVGGGLGYQSYPNGSSVPLFFAARAFFFPGVIEPSVFGEVGYNVAKLKSSRPGSDDASGFLVGVGLGLDILFYRGFGWTLDAGGRMEMSKEYYWYIYSNGEMSPVHSRSTQDIYFVAGSGMTF